MQAGGILRVNTVVRACLIEKEGRNLHADLMVIKLKDFNIILGMVLLSKHYALVNYYPKRSEYCDFEQEKLIIVVERKIILLC